MIADPAGSNQQFQDQDIQDTLDFYREDVRFESLMIAPSIVNIANTSYSASIIYADYYSKFQWWEQDITIQGQGATNLPWVVLNPAGSDYITGHFQFELTPWANGTVPGQVPPVFATGKTFDVYAAAVELLEMWSATLLAAYDITVDGQTLRRSQLSTQKLAFADIYRRKIKPRTAKMIRNDINDMTGARRMRLLDSDDIMKS